MQGKKMKVFEDDLVTLLKKARKGDMEAFRKVVEGTKDKIYGALVAMVKRESIAEEILQEGYIALWENAFKVENPLNYLYKFCLHRGIDFLRKNEDSKFFSLEEEGENLSSYIPSPEVLVENIETSEKINKIISLLPPKERVVFLMSDYLGMDSFEIAAIVNSSPSTIRNQISSARKKFIKMFLEKKDD